MQPLPLALATAALMVLAAGQTVAATAKSP